MVDCWIIRLRLFHPELKVNKILIILYSFISVIYKIIDPTYKILNQKNRLHFLSSYLIFGYNPGLTFIKKCRKYPVNIKPGPITELKVGAILRLQEGYQQNGF
jgi:hypothetical protein